MSFEFKAIMVYHGCMIVMMILGRRIFPTIELMIAVGILVVAILLSIRRRIVHRWYWKAPPLNEMLGATIATVLTVLLLLGMLAVHMPGFPTDPAALPWYLSVAGIGAFNVLRAMNFASLSEDKFLASCQGSGTTDHGDGSPSNIEATWKRISHATLAIAFSIALAASLAVLYISAIGVSNGSLKITDSKTEPMIKNGRVIYITGMQKTMIYDLQIVSMIGISIGLLCGAALYFWGTHRIQPPET